ncbi:MAG: GlxA family transcriptional regulator, partial [Roseovarius indicus]
MAGTESFVFYLVDEFAHLSFSCAVEPLRIANLVSGKPLYEWSLPSENAENARRNNGTVVRVQGRVEQPVKADRRFQQAGS